MENSIQHLCNSGVFDPLQLTDPSIKGNTNLLILSASLPHPTVSHYIIMSSKWLEPSQSCVFSRFTHSTLCFNKDWNQLKKNYKLSLCEPWLQCKFTYSHLEYWVPCSTSTVNPECHCPALKGISAATILPSRYQPVRTNRFFSMASVIHPAALWMMTGARGSSAVPLFCMPLGWGVGPLAVLSVLSICREKEDSRIFLQLAPSII